MAEPCAVLYGSSMVVDTKQCSIKHSTPYYQWHTQELFSGLGGSTNSVEDRERRSGGSRPPSQGFSRQL
jgi:hypothetical protein